MFCISLRSNSSNIVNYRKREGSVPWGCVEIFAVLDRHADSHLPHEGIPEFLRELGKTHEE
jgi:hypothetical protein